MEIRARDGDAKPFVAPRHLALAAAIIATLGAIALLGPALNPSETTAPLPSSIEEVATPNPAPTLIPRPTPVALPTPSPIPAPTTVPTKPRQHASVTVVGTTELAIDEHGIWTRSDRSQNWTLTSDRELPENAWCRTDVNGKLAFVDPVEEGASSVAWFDPALPGWLDATEALPPIPQSAGLRSDDYCHGVVTSDARLMFATATDQALIFAVQRDNGSFQTRTISYPDDWIRGDSPSFVSVRPLRHGDDIVAIHCSYYIDTGCLTTYFQLDPAVGRVDGPTTMSWAEAGGAVILPSTNAAVTVYADLGGSIGQGFDLRQIGDEVWAVELIDELGYIQGPDFSLPVGRWAAGPLGEDLVPLGSGNNPVFTAGENSVIAAMIPLGDPTADGAWSQRTADDDRSSSFDDWERWSFDRAAHRWQSLRADPTESRLPEQPYTVPTLNWSRSTSTRDLVDAIQGEVRTWDEIVHTGSPIIAADRAFAHHAYVLWASGDRGETWTPQAGLAVPPGQLFCSAMTNAGFAYLADIGPDAADMTVELAGTTHSINWPVIPRVFFGDQGFRPCRPIWMDGRWWVGEVDHGHGTLRLTSTIDGQNFDSHTIELSGQWRDVLPGGSGWGTVNLYRDRGQIIARLCRSGDGFPCAQSVDLVLDATLLAEVLRSDNPYFVAESTTKLPGVDLAMRLILYEVGDELWSVELNSNTYGSGGDARVGRYGEPLEQVDGQWADVRLRYGQVMRCIYPQLYPVDPPTTCESQQPDGSWQPIIGSIAVEWATVPAGTPVTFWDRTDDGIVLVVPS